MSLFQIDLQNLKTHITVYCHCVLYVCTIIYRYETRSEELYSRYTWNLSPERHLYSGHTLRVFRYAAQELQVRMQSKVHWKWG